MGAIPADSALLCSRDGTLKLGKLICLYDDNQISIDGDTAGWFTDDTPARFRAYGWHVIPEANQLLAGLALLAVTLYLVKRGRNPWFTGLPMLFMLVSTVVAMLSNLLFGTFLYGAVPLATGLLFFAVAWLGFNRRRRGRERDARQTRRCR